MNFQQQWEDGDDNNRWWRFDPRVEWLIDTLKMLKQFKVLVICAHAETALDLEDALRLRSGISATVFHEGMSILERDRAAAYFADEEFGAQVLICSEIGSEGRNFQFAHHLVLFDLPAHPDLLEQRIDRLDRIGQRHTIQLHVPHLENSAQQRLFQWYHQALNAFLNTCPTGNALQHEFGPRLLPLLDGGEDKAWDALLAEGRARREALEAELHSGRDRLLELNSGGAGEGEALVEAIEEQDDDFALPIYMERLFDAYGIHSEDHSENALILKPSEKMLDAGFPLGDDEGVTITYDRAQALAREDMQFLTWEHPMVQGGMDLVLSGSMGNTSVALIKNKALKPGTVLLELLFVSEAVAPRALQLGRWLPPQALRCLLDANGNDLAVPGVPGNPQRPAGKRATGQRQQVRPGPARRAGQAVRRGRGQDRPAPRGTRGQGQAAVRRRHGRGTGAPDRAQGGQPERPRQRAGQPAHPARGRPGPARQGLPAPRGDPHPGRRLTSGNGCAKREAMGLPHGFFHFISSEGRNGGWPRAGRRSGIATVALRLIDLRQRSAAREGLQCP